MVAALLAFAAGLARLPEAGLQFLDSWCYARVAAEMAAGGDWIVPHWRGEPFLEKPPLLFWLTAALFTLFGESEAAARALAGLPAAGCVLLVFRIGAAAAGPPTGLLAALLLSATPMFLKWGRTYTTDPLFAFLSLAAFGCGWGAARRPALWPAAGALAALCVLTRGAASAPLLLTLGFLAVLGLRPAQAPRPGRAEGRRLAWIFLAAIVFLALASPWHVAMARRGGGEFGRVYLGEHTLARVQRNLIDSPRAADPLYYPGHLVRTGWPALPFLLWGLWRCGRNLPGPRGAWRIPARCPHQGDPAAGNPAVRLDRALLVYLGAHAALLAAMASRSGRYLLPVYPALALLAARGLASGLGERGAARLRLWGGRGALAAVLAIALWPGPIGTPRGAEWRALAAALGRSAAEQVEPGVAAPAVEVDPALLDPWSERAFWFYLRSHPGGSGGDSGARLFLKPVEAAAACLPPGCRVIGRGARYALLETDPGG
jgi:4-amino-4-deoxy-L-arabinose transferase-like glycosyltransferase